MTSPGKRAGLSVDVGIGIVGVGEVVPEGVGEIFVGTGEAVGIEEGVIVGEGVGVGVGEGLGVFWIIKSDTANMTTNNNVTRTTFLCRLRTCIYINTKNVSVFIYVAPK